MKPPSNIDDPRYVKAFAHPLRVRILALLQERRATPVELSRCLRAPVGTVSYHVRTLHSLGLIELVDETRVRGAVAHHYRARERPRISDEAWAQASPMAKQAAVGAALQTIDDYARMSAASGGFDRGEAHISRTNMRLDAEGWVQAGKACLRLLEELQSIEESAAERLARDPHDPGALDASLVVLYFEAVRLSEALAEQLAPGGERREPLAQGAVAHG